MKREELETKIQEAIIAAGLDTDDWDWASMARIPWEKGGRVPTSIPIETVKVRIRSRDGYNEIIAIWHHHKAGIDVLFDRPLQPSNNAEKKSDACKNEGNIENKIRNLDLFETCFDKDVQWIRVPGGLIRETAAGPCFCPAPDDFFITPPRLDGIDPEFKRGMHSLIDQWSRLAEVFFPKTKTREDNHDD